MDNLITSSVPRPVSKLIGAARTAWKSFVRPVCMDNSGMVSAADLVATPERCIAVVDMLTGDLAKRASSITPWWDASRKARSSHCVSESKVRGACRSRCCSHRRAAWQGRHQSQPKTAGAIARRSRRERAAQRWRTSRRSIENRRGARSASRSGLSQIRDFSHLEDEAA
jgi:hypothetical protein